MSSTPNLSPLTASAGVDAASWPPPGLDPLLGAGARLTRSATTLALLVIALFVWLARLPVALSPQWYRILADPTLAPGTIPVALWDLGTGGLGLLIAIAGLISLLRSLQLTRRLYRGRAMGYPIGVLVDVALDRRADWPALTNGTGPFADLAPATRQRLLVLRRRRAAWALVAVALVALGALCWRLGWLAPAAFPSPLTTRREVLLAFTPALVAFLVMLWYGKPEGDVRRRDTARRAIRHHLGLPRDIVATWLEAHGRSVAPAAPGGFEKLMTWGPALFAIVAGIILIMVIIPPLAVQWAGGSYLRGWGRENAILYLRAARADSDSTAPFPTLERLLRSAGKLPEPPSAVDTESARALAGISVVGNVPPRGWTLTAADLERYHRDFPLTPASSATKTAWDQLGSGLDAKTRADLAGDTATPALALWRRLARAQSLRPLWMYGQGLTGAGGLTAEAAGGIPLVWRPVVLALARRNLAAGALAAANGHADQALLRVRENLAVAALMNQLPSPAFGPAATDAILPPTLEAMRALAAQRRDPALRHEADAIQDMLQVVQRRRESFANLALMLDPVSPPGLAFVGNPRISPVERWQLISAVVNATCFSPREMLFGVRRERSALLDTAVSLAVDIPRTAEWVALQHRRLGIFGGHSMLKRFFACWGPF